MNPANMEEEKQEEEKRFDEGAATAAAVDEKLADALTPGFLAEFSPGEAELAGAFVETALSEDDAADSAIDLAGALAPAGGARE